MGDPVNIQNLLQAGYFKTSRSRSKSPGYDQLEQDRDEHYSRDERLPDDYAARYEQKRPSPEPIRLPPPSSHATSTSRSKSPGYNQLHQDRDGHYNRAEQPRDDYAARYEQQRRSPEPIRLPPPSSHTRSTSRSKPAPPRPTVDDEDSIAKKEHGYIKTPNPEEEAASRGDLNQAQTIMGVHEFNPERRFVILEDDPATSTSDDKTDSSEEKAETRPKSTDSSKPSSRPDASSQHHRRAPSAGVNAAPSTGRRRSRQDLPVLETEFSDRRLPEHHRSRSAVNGPRPDYFNPSRPPRPYGEQLLSPEIMKQSSRGREESYYGGEYRDKPREGRYSRISPEHSTRRSDTVPEPRATGRTNSIDRGSERRQREYYPSSSRENTASRPPQHSSRDSARSSAHASREHSRSKDDYPKTSLPQAGSQKPLVVQEDRPLDIPRAPDTQKNIDTPPPRSSTIPPEKGPSRTSTMPVFPAEKPPVLRPSATINLAKESQHPVQSSLPYPEEDGFNIDPLSPPHNTTRFSNGHIPAINMPTLPPESKAELPARPRPADASASQNDSPAPEGKEWKPPSFDPEKDGVKLDRPVGTYRRYSENKNEPASDRLPNCPRMKPVVGKVDWLTLPRTDFNICPDCYGQVFSNSDYRTDFHPVLRPTVDAIACDFGSSPWYRIAWLLVLKKKDTDLQVFHDIAAISSAARGQRCPGDRKTTRDWYTVKDPYTKRPVPEFTVCYQCAKTVEALLPSLNGVFVPLDSRSSPVRGNCALHFAPDRTDFVLYFDAFETTADKAESSKKSPDLGYLAQKVERLSVHNACREDKPITDGYWHFMQFLPHFTVCADCFEDVVQPRLSDENVIARNFYIKPQKIAQATCQLYSPRMRDVFKRACRRNDPKYLESKVRERLDIEASIKSKLAKLDREGQRDARTDKQIDDLIEEWKEWE